MLALVLSGIALVGLPPSGAYLAKGLLIEAAGETDQFWWRIVIEASGAFTSCYLVLVLVHVFMRPRAPVRPIAPERFTQAAPAVALALCSLAIGLVPWESHRSASAESLSLPFSFSALAGSLWPFLGGTALALVLGRWRRPAAAGTATAVSSLVAGVRQQGRFLTGAIEWLDVLLRQWLVATLLLLVLIFVFAAAVMHY